MMLVCNLVVAVVFAAILDDLLREVQASDLAAHRGQLLSKI